MESEPEHSRISGQIDKMEDLENGIVASWKETPGKELLKMELKDLQAYLNFKFYSNA